VSFEEQMQFLLVSQKSHDDQIAALIERESVLKDHMDTLAVRTTQAMTAIHRLANIAVSHEERLDDLGSE
jgi:hypothetical protein